MAIKRFCDSCGKEMGAKNSIPNGNIRAPKGGVVFVITEVGFNDYSKGDVCRYCLFDEVARLDDRPKEGIPTPSTPGSLEEGKRD